MSTTDNGGPAFPANHYDLTDNEHGMTLRDYFAAKAMATVPPQTAYNMRPNEKQEDYIARVAYKQADAMLKARQS
jgi:hypothetical protein